MNRFCSTFRNRHVVLPVIHVTGSDQARRNAHLAFDRGVDGVFLINHAMDYRGLLEIHGQVTREYPTGWVGLNCLDRTPHNVFACIPANTHGVWVDNALIDESEVHQSEAQDVLDAQRRAGWQGLYFGGVAFKYQRPVHNLAAAVQIATRYMDVVTTSGSGTGHAPDLAKIRQMKQAMGAAPLAIASGITPENVAEFLPWTDCFLVATGISRSFDELDAERLRMLVDRVRSA